jgi:hypothetical protein
MNPICLDTHPTTPSDGQSGGAVWKWTPRVPFVETIEICGNKSIAGPVILIDTGKHRYLCSKPKASRIRQWSTVHALVDKLVSKDRRL